MTALIFLLIASSFALGMLIGNGYVTRSQDARDRRQAVTQRSLNEQWRVLRNETERYDRP